MKSDMVENEELKQVSPIPIYLDEAAKKDADLFEESQERSILKKILVALQKVQKYSAYVFTSFVGIHAISVIGVPGIGISLDRSQEVFELGRAVYLSFPGFELSVIIGSSICHVAAGIGARMVRFLLRRQRGINITSRGENTPIIKSEAREDIGLGGITSLIGLGYRKSIVSKYMPGVTPLQFSGYVFIPLLIYHFCKFRYAPLQLEGDSSLISLNYISFYLKKSPLNTLGNIVNYLALFGLSTVAAYHITYGMLVFQRKSNSRNKKRAYSVIVTVMLLTYISLSRFRKMALAEGFMGKLFARYATYIGI